MLTLIKRSAKIVAETTLRMKTLIGRVGRIEVSMAARCGGVAAKSKRMLWAVSLLSTRQRMTRKRMILGKMKMKNLNRRF